MQTLARRARTLLCLAFLAFAVSASAQTPGEFRIVALPDTQFYAKSYPWIFNAQTQWISNHVRDMNIQLVIGLGDIVDGGGALSQWQNADGAYRRLDGVVPYVAAIGNHDYDQNNPSGRTAYTKNFNTFFGPSRYAGKSWYRGSYPAGSNENFYATLTLGGRSYLILVLEVFPRDSALDWAANVIKANPDKAVIVVTHAYTYYDNTRMVRCDSNSAGSFGVSQDNDGDAVWEKLVSRYSNIAMVLSGHVVQGDGTGRREDIGLNGNLVNAMLSDYQSWTNGGNGYLRIITVRPALNQIQVQTYSPYLNAYLTTSHHQFTVPFQNYGLTAATGSIYGKVKSAIDCSALAGVTVSFSGGTATTDSYGNYSVAAAGPAGYSTTAKRSGWGSVTKQVGVVAGQPSPTKYLMSTSGVIRGTITNSSGGTVYGASITVKGGLLNLNKTVTTDSSGAFYSGWIPVGKYTLTIEKTGYQSGSVGATVYTGQTTTVNYTLQ